MYSRVKETAKVPTSIFCNEEIGTTRIFDFQNDHINMTANQIKPLIIGKTTNKENEDYRPYIDHWYQIPFYGYKIVDDEIAQIEEQKLMQKLNIKQKESKNIRFNTLNELKDSLYKEYKNDI